jgi:hypothetical protein
VTGAAVIFEKVRRYGDLQYLDLASQNLRAKKSPDHCRGKLKFLNKPAGKTASL